MPYRITQCYLPPGRGDIPALNPAEAGTRLSDPGGMQGWVDLKGGQYPLAAWGEENFENLTTKWSVLKYWKILFFACFRFLIFHPFFQGGQLTPFAHVRTRMEITSHELSTWLLLSFTRPAYVFVNLRHAPFSFILVFKIKSNFICSEHVTFKCGKW